MTKKIPPHSRIPHSLKYNDSFYELSVKDKWLFETILKNARYSKGNYNDHGFSIELEVGEYCNTIRKIQDLCGPDFTKNDIERGLERLVESGFLRQEVRHIKSVLTILDSDTLELLKQQSETGNETGLRQERDKIETESNKEKKEKKEKNTKKEKINKKENIPEIPKTAYREFVHLTLEQYAKLVEVNGEAVVNDMLDELNAYKGSTGNTYDSDAHTMNKGGWVYKKVVLQQQTSKVKTPENLREQMLKRYPEKKFKGADVYIEENAIGMQRGYNHHQVKFTEKGFFAQLDALERKFS